MKRLVNRFALGIVLLGLLTPGCAGSSKKEGGQPGQPDLTEAVPGGPLSAEEEQTVAFSEEEDAEALSGDLEMLPEMPEDLPDATDAESAALDKQLDAFFAGPDEELAEQIDGLKIYRGIPPEGARLPDDEIPILLNPYVEQWILYFTGKGEPFFRRWLERLPRYKGLFEDILQQHNVPKDMVYLAMIESGFSSRAYSRAKAVGIWQFMMGTGKLYNLKVDWWLDERRDPIKATHAAARHLRDLHDEFGSWYLAAAAYNAGAGKIRRGLARYDVSSFWSLLHGKYLRPETKHYVPKMLAAMIVAKAPERFGFVDLQPEEPLAFESVTVPPATDLAVVAKATGRDLEEIKDLNPHLRRWFTPPEGKDSEIRLPVGAKDAFAANFPKMNRRDKNIFLTHTVRKGETLSQLAYIYDTDIWAIKRLNGIGKYLRSGQILQIPVRPGTKPREAPPQLASSSRMLRAPEIKAPAGHEELLHVVERGDTLWSISERFGVNISDLKRWNDIARRSRIFPGDVVSIFLPADKAKAFQSTAKVKIRREASVDPKTAKSLNYKVRRGETGWSIARKHGVEFRDLENWNPEIDWSRLRPGDMVKVYVASNVTN